jgi:hypothetical protein
LPATIGLAATAHADAPVNLTVTDQDAGFEQPKRRSWTVFHDGVARDPGVNLLSSGGPWVQCHLWVRISFEGR